MNNDPLPYLGEEVEQVSEVGLSGGRVDNRFKRDTEEGETEYKNKDPEDEVQHPPYYTTSASLDRVAKRQLESRHDKKSCGAQTLQAC